MKFLKILSQNIFPNIQMIWDGNTRSKIGIALLRRFLRTGLFYIFKRSWRRGAARFFFGSIRVFFWSLRQHYNTSSCLIWWFAHLREKWSPCWKQMWRRLTHKVFKFSTKFGLVINSIFLKIKYLLTIFTFSFRLSNFQIYCLVIITLNIFTILWRKVGVFWVE